jgi:hypothetical protein
MSDGYEPGQRVRIRTDDGDTPGVFVRAGEPTEAITLESPGIVGPYKRDVAWVERDDTGDLATVVYARLHAA